MNGAKASHEDRRKKQMKVYPVLQQAFEMFSFVINLKYFGRDILLSSHCAHPPAAANSLIRADADFSDFSFRQQP
jgi:hypothetical protein